MTHISYYVWLKDDHIQGDNWPFYLLSLCDPVGDNPFDLKL